MESRSIDHYIVFGTQFRFLADAQEDWRVHGEGYVLSNIDAFLRNLDWFSLPVTQRASYELANFADPLRDLAEDAHLSAEDANELRQIMLRLRPTLYAEAAGLVAFAVSDKRYDVRKLMEDVGSLLADGVFQRLPEIAQTDFQEAGMCIAFVRPTAAAFHLLRATEAVLRQYYRGMVRQNRIQEPWMWGPMMDDMRGRRIAPDATLAHTLDGLRQHFRNPTQHPEKVYDIDEAQDLFAACLDAVNRMVASERWIDP